jgi:hypothetical protein
MIGGQPLIFLQERTDVTAALKPAPPIRKGRSLRKKWLGGRNPVKERTEYRRDICPILVNLAQMSGLLGQKGGNKESERGRLLRLATQARNS